MTEFLQYLKSVDRSATTIHGYENDLQIFFTWNLLFNNNKFFIDLNKREVMRYQSYLLSINNSPNRIRRLKSALSSMSIFIENILDDDYPNFRNIINKIESPVKTQTRTKTIVTAQEVETVLKYLTDREQYLKACVFALAVCSGSRKSELTRFKVNYFDDSNIVYGSLYKTPELMKTKGKGSRGKMLDRYTLVKDFKPYFDLWMAQREKLGVDSEYLFVSKDEATGKWKPITIYTLNSMAITFSRVLGIDFYWHSLRHLFVSRLMASNIPAEIVKKIVGWESVDMVGIYNDADISAELGKYFDENGIKDNIQEGSLSNL